MKHRILKWYSYREADYYFALERFHEFKLFWSFKISWWDTLDTFGSYQKALNWQKHYKCEIIEQED